jgi:putative multiple sugar transport system substrate-binding protein
MRNKFFWLLATIMMCGAMITGLTSCSKSDDNNNNNNNQKKVVVLLPDNSRIERWGIDKANLESAMAMYGFKATFYVVPETPEGAVQQVEQLRNAINDGVKYIVVTAVDYKKINESGLLEQHPDVKVVCHDRFIQDNPRIAYFSSADTKEVGRTQAMFLLNHFHSSEAASMTLEILQGPQTDSNAKEYYEGAMELLKKYIDNGKLVVKSGKTEYKDVMADSWNIEDEKKAMQDRLSSYGAGECPDMVLAATDNASQGAIKALEEAGFTKMPVITGQDNSAASQSYIKSGKQTMTIDKNLKDMAYNTAMIVNSLMSNSPVYTSQSISGIPAIFSKITVMTQDSY